MIQILAHIACWRALTSFLMRNVWRINWKATWPDGMESVIGGCFDYFNYDQFANLLISSSFFGDFVVIMFGGPENVGKGKKM